MSSDQGLSPRLSRWFGFAAGLVLLLSFVRLLTQIPPALAALTGWRSIVAGVPADPAGARHAAYWAAGLASEVGDWDRVLQEMAPLADAGDPLALQLAAHAAEEKGDYWAAANYWARTVNVDGLLGIGFAAQQADDLDAALVAYQAAWALDPGLATDRLVIVLNALDDRAGAIEVYKMALASPGISTEKQLGWYLALGRLLLEEQRRDEAAAAFREALSIDPGNQQARDGLDLAIQQP